MSSPYDQTARVIQRRNENEHWAQQTLSGWRIGKWALVFYLVAAMVLPAAVALLIWSFGS